MAASPQHVCLCSANRLPAPVTCVMQLKVCYTNALLVLVKHLLQAKNCRSMQALEPCCRSPWQAVRSLAHVSDNTAACRIVGTLFAKTNLCLKVSTKGACHPHAIAHSLCRKSSNHIAMIKV